MVRRDKDRAACPAAAPYVHPKLSAIEHTGKDGDPIFRDSAETTRWVLSCLYDDFTAQQKANELGLNEEPEAAHRLRESRVAGSSPARAAGGAAPPAVKPISQANGHHDDEPEEGLGGVEILDPSLPSNQGLPPSRPADELPNGAAVVQNPVSGKFEATTPGACSTASNETTEPRVMRQ